MSLCRMILVLLACLTWVSPASADEALTDVRIQLKWFHQFQFAGYYAALKKGYFREAGLDVTLIEGGPHINPTNEVLADNADFGIGTSGLLVSRSKGKPVVAVAAVFQHSPYILITRDDPEIRTVHDLKGRSVMVEPYSEELIAYLVHQGLDPDEVNLVEHSGDVLDIYTDRAVGLTAYTTTEPYMLREAGKPYHVFDPKVAGIDFYGDTLFTTTEYAKAHADTVTALREAVICGWRYALQNQEEIIDLILSEYNSEHTHDYLRYEADDIRRLLIPDLIEIGYMNPQRWEHIADEFEAAGLMDKKVNIDSFLFRTQTNDWKWLLNVLLVSTTLIIVIILILAKFYRLNQHLQAEIQRRMALEKELEERAITDYGTGVLNRRGLLEVLEKEFDRTERNDTTLSLLELDLDYFKNINDTYGHAAGDRALVFVAAVCRGTVRSIDSVGRVGGEEFMILLPNATVKDAQMVAERILSILEDTPLGLADGQEITLTASIGVAELLDHEDISLLMRRVDQAMYEAKNLGRGTISVSRGDGQS